MTRNDSFNLEYDKKWSWCDFGFVHQNCSRDRKKHLESLRDFVSRATQELIWLNEKEEEEVAFDWSDRNSNVTKKKDYHAVSSCLIWT